MRSTFDDDNRAECAFQCSGYGVTCNLVKKILLEKFMITMMRITRCKLCYFIQCVRQSAELLGQGIGTSQGLYLHREMQKNSAYTHESSGN